jgi:hypothetical protein
MCERSPHSSKEREVGLEKRDIAPDPSILRRDHAQRAPPCLKNLLQREKPAQAITIRPRRLGGIKKHFTCPRVLDLFQEHYRVWTTDRERCIAA